MRKNFVFLHLGSDPFMPSALVRSIRRLVTDANVIQCTDSTSVAVPDVDHVERINLDPSRIMLSRLQAFAKLGLNEPALYVDTDMLLLKPIDPAGLLTNAVTAAVCRRSFQRDAIFNHRMRGLDFSEYRGKTLDQVFPIIACTTATALPSYWEDCLYALEVLDEKYQVWYGDQEAMKIVAESSSHRIAYLPECLYGCLPEMVGTFADDPFIVHFKGASRKQQFGEWCARLQLSTSTETRL